MVELKGLSTNHWSAVLTIEIHSLPLEKEPHGIARVLKATGHGSPLPIKWIDKKKTRKLPTPDLQGKLWHTKTGLS